MSTASSDRLRAVAEAHDWDADGVTTLGTFGCVHFAEWCTELFGPDPLVVDTSALASNDNLRKAGALLQHAGVPANWLATLDLISQLETTEEQDQPVRALVAAVNARFANLLDLPVQSRDSALNLAYLFESELFLSDWINDDSGDYNYVPRHGLARWLPRYLAIVDQYLTPQDLAQLTHVGEDPLCCTEILSRNCPEDKLAAAIARSWWGPLSQAPNISAELIAENLENQPDLWFHPNANPEQAWAVIHALLDSGDGYDLVEALRPFDNARDDAWNNVMEYQLTGPLSTLLRDRIKAWCRENPDEGEEIFDELFYGEEFEEEDE